MNTATKATPRTTKAAKLSAEWEAFQTQQRQALAELYVAKAGVCGACGEKIDGGSSFATSVVPRSTGQVMLVHVATCAVGVLMPHLRVAIAKGVR